MYQLTKNNLADSVTIYGRGRELFRPPTYRASDGHDEANSLFSPLCECAWKNS